MSDLWDTVRDMATADRAAGIPPTCEYGGCGRPGTVHVHAAPWLEMDLCPAHADGYGEIDHVSRVLLATARQSAPGSVYRPMGWTPGVVMRHPRDGAPGYTLHRPGAASDGWVWTDGTGVVRSISQSA